MTMKKSTLIGNRIKTERQVKEWSQEDLARKLGLSRVAVTYWESGDTKGLKPENLVRVARLFGVRVEWLVFGDSEPKYPLPCHHPDPTRAPNTPLQSDSTDMAVLASHYIAFINRLPKESQRDFTNHLVTTLIP